MFKVFGLVVAMKCMIFRLDFSFTFVCGVCDD